MIKYHVNVGELQHNALPTTKVYDVTHYLNKQNWQCDSNDDLVMDEYEKWIA